MRRTRRLTLGLLSILAVSAVAAGAIAMAAGDDDSAFMGIAPRDAPYDLRFIDEMVMHHRGAVMSAHMMIADSERPELRDLARRIAESQSEQIDRMERWRKEWYPDAPPATMGGGMMMGGGMTGMGGDSMGDMGGDSMGGGDMGGMMPRDMMGGDTTDRMFLRMMIPHHQLAVDMAQDAQERADHEPLKGLAREIEQGQMREIVEMEGYLREWYDEASTRDTAGPMRDMMQRMLGR
ncbi:MAG: DUF305 domain-containing protein [Solirubrobacteraceae bacterium MAG38_C4-C5]|nr:DUF305 domain-containing protein [Candidatus Siliceabacter maunaloa]